MTQPDPHVAALVEADDCFRPPANRRAEVRQICEALLPMIQKTARDGGWCIVGHGSMERDFDLLAVPWTETAAPEDALIAMVMNTAAQELNGQCYLQPGDPEKPHGRRAYTITIDSDLMVRSSAGCHPFIDLSIVDLRAALAAWNQREATPPKAGDDHDRG